MSVTPAAAFGLKGDDPGVLALKGILVVKLLIWETHRMVLAVNARGRRLRTLRLRRYM